MSAIAATGRSNGTADETRNAGASPAATAGAASFSDLVRAHFCREQARAEPHGTPSADAEERYCERLEQFEQQEGRVAAVYWSSRDASAVAITIGAPRNARNPISETEMEIRIHRVTDWVTKDSPLLANLLHECDLLAIRVGEILRGTSERIAMRWIYSVEEHVLGHVERRVEGDVEGDRAFVKTQRAELARIEEYYLRAGAKAGRIVYVSGMFVGAAFVAAVCAAVALALAATGNNWDAGTKVLLLSVAAGAVGAFVSVLARMSGGGDRFTVDFEVGRPLLRRLGLYKPLVGSVFGVALYCILASGLLMTKPPDGAAVTFYGAVAFLAGFSERFTGVIFGDVERLISGKGKEQPEAAAEPVT